MSRIKLRSCNTTRRCSRCPDGLYDIEVDDVVLCEDCLVAAVRATMKKPEPISEHEARQLEGEITKLTGHSVRGLKHLPVETITELRRAVRNVEQEKSGIKSRLRRYGLPGI